MFWADRRPYLETLYSYRFRGLTVLTTEKWIKPKLISFLYYSNLDFRKFTGSTTGTEKGIDTKFQVNKLIYCQIKTIDILLTYTPSNVNLLRYNECIGNTGMYPILLFQAPLLSWNLHQWKFFTKDGDTSYQPSSWPVQIL